MFGLADQQWSIQVSKVDVQLYDTVYGIRQTATLWYHKMAVMLVTDHRLLRSWQILIPSFWYLWEVYGKNDFKNRLLSPSMQWWYWATNIIFWYQYSVIKTERRNWLSKYYGHLNNSMTIFSHNSLFNCWTFHMESISPNNSDIRS